jgi:hypothetical protein
MVQYPRPYGFARLYASRSEDLLLSHIAMSSCQVLSYGWVNQSPNDSIAVAYDYESDSLTTTLSQLY